MPLYKCQFDTLKVNSFQSSEHAWEMAVIH